MFSMKLQSSVFAYGHSVSTNLSPGNCILVAKTFPVYHSKYFVPFQMENSIEPLDKKIA